MVFRDRRPSRHRADSRTEPGTDSRTGSTTPPTDELESYLAAISPEADAPSELAGRFGSAQVFQVRLPSVRIEQLRRLAEARGVPPTSLLVDWVLERLDKETNGETPGNGARSAPGSLDPGAAPDGHGRRPSGPGAGGSRGTGGLRADGARTGGSPTTGSGGFRAAPGGSGAPNTGTGRFPAADPGNSGAPKNGTGGFRATDPGATRSPASGTGGFRAAEPGSPNTGTGGSPVAGSGGFRAANAGSPAGGRRGAGATDLGTEDPAAPRARGTRRREAGARDTGQRDTGQRDTGARGSRHRDAGARGSERTDNRDAGTPEAPRRRSRRTPEPEATPIPSPLDHLKPFHEFDPLDVREPLPPAQRHGPADADPHAQDSESEGAPASQVTPLFGSHSARPADRPGARHRAPEPVAHLLPRRRP